jgi:hypothetical protein
MNDDRVLKVLEEMRDLLRQNVANYQEALGMLVMLLLRVVARLP